MIGENTTIRKSKSGRSQIIRDNLTGYAFISVFILLYVIFTLYPLIQGFFISFNDWNIVGAKKFVGLDNYIRLLNDKKFWQALLHTFEFLIYSTPVMIIGSFLIAVLINSQLLKGKALFRAVFFSPNVLTVSIITYMWLVILDPYAGLINSGLKSLGLLGADRSNQIFWLKDKNIVWWSVTMITFWWTMGYNMILYLASMQNISDSLYESASLDGANGWQKMIYITIPSLKRIHATLLFLQIIASFKVFGQTFLVTGGGPAGRTKALIQYIYEVAFQRFYMGDGSAGAFLLFIIIFFVSFIQMKLMDHAND